MLPTRNESRRLGPRQRGLTTRALARARSIGDERADELMGELARHPRREAIDRLLARVRDTQTPLPSGLPRSLRRFLEEEGLPAWADRERLLRAQRFSERNVMAIAIALFCAALPSAFTGAKGVSVLYATGRLEHDVDARVNETGRFVFDVLMPGGFESGHAVRAAQKVRLLHAGVRHAVRGRAGADVPINQEDLLGTLTCFSIVVLDALESMGVAVSRREAEDYLHLWLVVGAMLGIHQRLLPHDVAVARRLGEDIRARQTASSADGRKLAKVLLDGIERHLPLRGLGLLGPGLMRMFLGEAGARTLGLPKGLSTPSLSLLFAGSRALLGAPARDDRALSSLRDGIARTVLELTMSRKLEGREPAYERPLAEARCPFRPSPR